MRSLARLATLVLIGLAQACGSVAGHADGGAGDGSRADGAPTDGTSDEATGVDGPRRGDSAGTGDAAGTGDVLGTTDVAETGDAVGTADVGDRMADPCRQTPVALRSAASFALLAGAAITNTGLTTVVGDVGVSPGTAISGFPPGATVGLQHGGDPVAAQAEADLKTAFDDAAGRTLCSVLVAGNLGGKTLGPGLYSSTSSLAISAGDLTLDARGDADAVFIFQMTTTLNTTTGRQVLLVGGAQAGNVFWQVGTSATFGSASTVAGTIMAAQSITVATGTKVKGRLLARFAAATLDTDTIAKP